MFSVSVIKIAPGWLGLAASEKGLARVCFPQKTKTAARESVLQAVAPRPIDFGASSIPFQSYANEIAEYLAGRLEKFSMPVDLSGFSDFDIAVWKAARAIPYGETRSYGWVASAIRRPGASRAVGSALGRNPIPIVVPCHRVVRSSGALGGFGAGIEWKKRLLELESRRGEK